MQTLGERGRTREELYTNHFGDLPTHCPQWTNMNNVERRKTAKTAEYCLQCLSPNVRIKHKTDSNRHNQRRCAVSIKRKHKYTCLNTSCLTHSWTCTTHAEENRPLTEAHYRELRTWGQYMPNQTTPDHSKAKQRQARKNNLERTSPKRTAKPTPGLQDLTATIKSRITTSNYRLAAMMTPIRNPKEGAARADEINRVCGMANEIKSSLLDIKTHHKNTLDVLELGNFRSLLSNIESRNLQPTGS